ncbi:MFS general substrate transporter [Dendrothele bispora CBS 962.96]|uniref:MFS general substrate transporter n=1 Tax=Dendrothele bispora (strain CBS 962.96) TaxID=1314807 RepID=A0A4S8KZK7_DENBC|nr:MFS general substrate transporter [Dendrothele bispora CBS 962.96]
MFSGTGVGGVVVPIVSQALLERYGRRTTLIGSAIAFLVVIIPCFPYLKGRLPVAQAVNTRSFHTQFFRNPVFWIIFVANMLQGFGSFIPSLYLPTFASDVNMSSTAGTLAVSLMNGASAPGLVFLGWLSDTNVSQSILISSLSSSLSVFFLWGFTGGLGPLLAFACVYGFMALSWSAMWPRFVSAAAIDDPIQISNVMGLLVFGKGIAGVLSAPVASGLLHPWYFTNKTAFAYGVQGYGPLIVFTGVSLLGGSLGSAFRLLQKSKYNGEFRAM